MKAKTAGYWIATALMLLVFGGGGFADVLLVDPVREALLRLGYPLYVGRLLGVLKILGMIVVLAPGLPLLKEWAYAGFAFDLLGAAVSHVSIGDPVGEVAPPFVVAVFVGASYLLRPDARRLEAAPSLLPAEEPCPQDPKAEGHKP